MSTDADKGTLFPQLRDVDPGTFQVLVADDHRNMRVLVGKTLRNIGFRVDEATNGDELLELARRRRPDLIILDIMMPVLDGLGALKQLRADPNLSSTYVILVTGKSSIEEKIEGFRCGADDYLTKPVALEELKARVQAGIRIKTMQRCLEESQRLLIRQEKLATIGVLAAGVAHEFNNIMSGISGYAQLARQNDRFKDRLIEVAVDQVKRAQKITSSLSTFAAGMTAGTRRTQLSHLLESSICLVEKEIKSRDIEITVDLEEGLPTVMVNFGQMQQVLVHLLLNALQAVSFDGRIEVRVRRLDDRVGIEVDDSGHGIDPEVRHRIFDPFFTTKGALGSAEEPGTGLGLTFSLNILHAHKGTLDLVDSRLGGTCMRASVPIVEAEVSDAIPSAPSATESAEVEEPRCHVVMVEDDPTLQEIVGELLDDVDLHVFDQGPPALEYCREHEVDACILDLNLAGPWDGRKVLEELRLLPSSPPVVITTGAVDENEGDELGAPVVEVVRKPFQLHELEAALQRALATASSG